MKLRFIGPALFGILTLASEVSAEPPPSLSSSERPDPLDEPPRSEVKTVERWYGWHTLLGAGPSVVLVGAGLISGANDGGHGFSPQTIMFTSSGLAGLVFSGPIVHWAHGFVGRGFVSLGMNLLIPSCGMGLGLALGMAGDRPDVGFIAGTLAGVLIAPALDIGFMTYKDVPADPLTDDRPAWARSLTLVPRYGRDGAGLSIAGIF